MLHEQKNIKLLELLEHEPHFVVAPKVFPACSFLFQSDKGVRMYFRTLGTAGVWQSSSFP